MTANLAYKKTIKEILLKNGIHLTKRLGQNFLINAGVVSKVVDAANVQKKDVVLEIGPGIGILTQEIAKKAKLVIAIEKDKMLAEIAKETLREYGNLTIINQDILKADIEKIFSELELAPEYKIVANLPYNIALRVLRIFLEHKTPPQTITVIIQKEVSQKICDSKSNLPKIAFNFYGKPKTLFYVSKGSFWPEPKVDGAVLQIIDIQKNVPLVEQALFFRILKIGFAHPRKTILNNLSSGFSKPKKEIEEWLIKADIDFKARPEDLVMDDWVKLTYNFKL